LAESPNETCAEQLPDALPEAARPGFDPSKRRVMADFDRPVKVGPGADYRPIVYKSMSYSGFA
jgi:hypothetical protein